MKRSILLILVLSFSLVAASFVSAGGPPGGAIWADGHAYKTIGTPANFPDKGPKDGIYVFDNLEGQNPVAESKPGDKDYNGGRWQVYVLAFTEEGLAIHDANNDGAADFELMSWEDVQTHIGLGHLEQVAVGPSFECPLIK
ncbi:MAG: hypothetical protein DWP97_07250 [Calditrichaeota bacterium]|nr:MAG: hypothetical protein DWP97_07250 [Calditrichota bacterium]